MTPEQITNSFLEDRIDEISEKYFTSNRKYRQFLYKTPNDKEVLELLNENIKDEYLETLAFVLGLKFLKQTMFGEGDSRSSSEENLEIYKAGFLKGYSLKKPIK